MSPVRPNFDPANLYFITTTAVNRAHLFLPNEHKQIIAESLNYMRQGGWFRLYAFVVMPNHIHILVRFLASYKLANVMRDFKKYTSKEITKYCQLANNPEFLTTIKNAGDESSKVVYKVWENGYDARDVFSFGFLEQKLDYIHNNPCQSQWQLAEHPEDYRWSSARFYVEGRPAIIGVDDVREFLVSG